MSEIPEIVSQHSDAIEAITLQHAAKIAEIHLRPERGELDRGYNKAVRDIAEKLRELSKKREKVDA